MELDKRIIEGKKPLDCFDAKDARKQFIGKKGFFGAHESQFMDLDSCPKCVLDELKEVDNYAESPFMTSYNHCYRFFLPEEWVKEPEKKYREYKDLDEFYDVTGLEIGDLIKLKFPGNNVAELLIVGGCDNGLFIGIHKYTFKQLFEMVEISISGKWQPFGVINE